MTWAGLHKCIEKKIHTWQLLQLFVSLLIIYSWVSASFPQSFLFFCAHMNRNGNPTISLVWCD